MDFYTVLRWLHNLNRWLVVLFVLWALVRSLMGLRFGRPWERTDRRAMLGAVTTLDIQLLLGAVLYWLSPTTSLAFRDFAAAMQNGRFFVLEHPFYMLLALVLAHVGSVRARKAAGANAHRQALIFLGLALLFILLGMPWQRALLPWL